jgi:tRNA dimethylallyltransferase
MSEKLALIVAGPTASGKSGLALELARRLGGTVINADAMQCYRELRVLTARPTPAEEAEVPHRLYGIWPASLACSVALWREAALGAMREATLPILCGGTGMYLRALTQGINALPDVTPEARSEARRLLTEIGPEALHARLDAATAATLRPSDSQRIARAMEVLLSTGRGLVAWQRETPVLPPAPWRFAGVLLDPPRDALREAIRARWAAMMAGGAVEEVRGLLAQRLDPALPAMRAHGVPELAAVIRGGLEAAEASRRIIANTVAYTRRQATWFRHQAWVAPGRLHRINARFAGLAQFSESDWQQILSFIDSAR